DRGRTGIRGFDPRKRRHCVRTEQPERVFMEPFCRTLEIATVEEHRADRKKETKVPERHMLHPKRFPVIGAAEFRHRSVRLLKMHAELQSTFNRTPDGRIELFAIDAAEAGSEQIETKRRMVIEERLLDAPAIGMELLTEPLLQYL